MHTVEIQLGRTNLREAMNVMRAWLDDQRFEPSVFVCHENSGKLLLSVSFKVGEEAEAFASRFGGKLTGSEPNGWRPRDSSPSFVIDAECVGSSGAPPAATTGIGTSDGGGSVTQISFDHARLLIEPVDDARRRADKDERDAPKGGG